MLPIGLDNTRDTYTGLAQQMGPELHTWTQTLVGWCIAHAHCTSMHACVWKPRRAPIRAWSLPRRVWSLTLDQNGGAIHIRMRDYFLSVLRYTIINYP